MPAGNPEGYAEQPEAPEGAEQAPKGPSSPDDASVVQESMLATAKSLNGLKSAIAEAGAPPEVLEKITMAADAFSEFLQAVGADVPPPEGGKKAPMGAPVPADAASGGKVMPADNMAAGRKGARPMMG